MFKATPNPPHTDPLSPQETLDAEKLDQAAQKVLDYYLKPNHSQPDEKPAKQPDYFIVAPDADPEGMLAHTYETFCSVSTLILDCLLYTSPSPRDS